MKLFTKLLLSLFLILSVHGAYISAQNSGATFTITGKVHTPDKTGIPNVVVSDGHNVTVTDSNGEYTLGSNELAKFVFISVPSDYKIPHSGNVPKFYKAIKGTKEDITADFQLLKQEKDENFVLTVMADPQPQIQADLNRFVAEAIPDFENLTNYYPENTTFIGMSAGDIVWDMPGFYPTIIEALENITFPYFQVIGNHDHDENIKGNDYESSHNFEKFFGPAYYSFNRGDCHFIALDNIIYNTRTDYEEKITEEQLSWLEKDLSHVDKDKLIVIGMHAPAFRVGNNTGIINFNSLKIRLEGYKVIIISGHTHRMNKTVISDDIVEYTLAPTMGYAWAGDVHTNGCPNGYGVFEFEGNQLVNHYYMSTKREPDYQMNIYPAGVSAENPEHVAAHIWNYNTEWNVDVYENDVNMGKMLKISSFDPIAYDYYIGDKKPSRRPNLEPTKSNTMFFYKPKDKTSEIKVVATNEFGKAYSGTMKQTSVASEHRQVFFAESFGAGAEPAVDITNWTNWQNVGITITDGDCDYIPDVRRTYQSSDITRGSYPEASGENNVYFKEEAAGNTRGFAINGINASAFKNIELTFGYNKQKGGVRGEMDVYYWNGFKWVQLSVQLKEEAEAAGWYRSPVISLPKEAETESLKLRFVKPPAFKGSIRLDDVWLTGEPKILEAPSTGDAGDIQPDGFKLQWEEYEGATGYLIDISKNENFTTGDEAEILAAWTFPEPYTAGEAAKANIYSANNQGKILSCTATGNSENPVPYSAGAGSESNPYAYSSTGWDDGAFQKYFHIETDASGYYGLTLSSDVYSSANGPKNMIVQYRLNDDAEWIDVPGSELIMPQAAYGTTSKLTGLPLPTACNNQPRLSIRWVMSGSLRTSGAAAYIVTSGGASRISNIYVKGIKADLVAEHNNILVSENSYTATGLESGKTYYYKVRATNGKLVSEESATKSVSTAVTAAENIADNKNMFVFYSAATKSFEINYSETAEQLLVQVSDLNGRILNYEKLAGTNRRISASHLPSGMYIVSLFRNGQKINFKCNK